MFCPAFVFLIQEMSVQLLSACFLLCLFARRRPPGSRHHRVCEKTAGKSVPVTERLSVYNRKVRVKLLSEDI